MFSVPSSAFRKTPYFYFLYDGAWVLICVAVMATCTAVGWNGFDVEWGWHVLGLLAVATYAQIIGSGTIHNAAHRNWWRPANRLIGELAGIVVMTRFASWEILHTRHHQFSDDPEKDPHYAIPGFWRFFFKIMLGNLEPNIRQQYLEVWGDTPKYRTLDRVRSVVSFSTMIVLATAWYYVLGPVLFAGVFAPSAVLGAIHISHFNWITHRGDKQDGDYRPVNLDHGLYWLGNRVCFGLYFHGTHHENPRVFNPMLAHRRQQQEATRAAA